MTAKPVTLAKPAAAMKQVSMVSAEKQSMPAKSTTIIEAKVDVGFGNNLFVRGQGAGLSWQQGKPLTCVDGTTWRWTAEARETFQFKLLLNDRVWARGEDVVATPGKRVEIKPAF